MASGTGQSGTASLFEKAVEEMLRKLEGDISPGATHLRNQAFELRLRTRAWTRDVDVAEKTQAMDELFALFRQVMEKRP